jgi:antitoxin component of RelBE/YafQ-DinJ toxin-antitoxin module
VRGKDQILSATRTLAALTSILRKTLVVTTTDLIRIFLHQVRLHKGLPFDLRLKVEDNSDVLLPVAIRQSALDSVYDD